MDSEGSEVHYLNFQLNEQPRSGLVFAIINSAHSKTVPTLSREEVLKKLSNTITYLLCLIGNFHVVQKIINSQGNVYHNEGY